MLLLQEPQLKQQPQPQTVLLKPPMLVKTWAWTRYLLAPPSDRPLNLDKLTPVSVSNE